MPRRATQVLVMLGVCLLCFVITAFAQNNGTNGNNGNNGNSANGNNGNNGNSINGNSGNRISAPEIDVSAAPGALMIAAGTLALLRERLRRP